MSDTFNGFHLMRTAIYNRLVWLAVFAGAYLFSLLFTRRYQKGFAALSASTQSACTSPLWPPF